ncbi:MAG: hypothetical protein V1678_05115 [Candidatus Aenigmatarchaeota archaeon]
MKKLLFAFVLMLLASPILCLSENVLTYSSVESEITSVEEMANQYQNLILNLNSQGAYASKSIKLLSEMKDILWQAKMFLSQSRVDEASQMVEKAKSIAPRITLDISFSLKINKGRLALEEASTLISKARKEGYEVKTFEGFYDKAVALFAQAKSSYESESYEAVDPKISEITSLAENVSKGVDSLKVVREFQPTTGFVISFSDVNVASYWWVGVITVFLVAAIIIKTRKTVKKLSQVSRLEIIKNRMR